MTAPESAHSSVSARVPGIEWGAIALMALLVVALLGSLAGLLVATYGGERASERRAHRLSLLEEQERLAVTLFRQTPRALSGIEPAFSAIRHARDASKAVLADLDAVYPVSAESTAYRALNKEWSGLVGALDLILSAEEPVLGLRESLESLVAFAEALESQALVLLAGAPGWEFEPGQTYAASNLRLLSARLRENLRHGLDSNRSLADSERYGEGAKLLTAIGDAVTGLSLGDRSLGIARVSTPSARALLERLGGLYRDASDVLKSIMSNTLVIVHVHETGETFAVSAKRIPVLSAELRQITAAPRKEKTWATEAVRTGFAAAAIVILLAAAATFFFWARARVHAERARAEEVQRRHRASSEASRRNQAAILNLLDEVGPIGDDPVAVEAGATEDLTGTIADALSHVIESLRETLVHINDISGEIGSGASKTQVTASALSTASQVQVQRMAQANDALHLMSSAVARIAQEASESSQAAAQSVEIASQGAKAVRDTISGMNTVRETLQQGAQRLKRLRESSREMGDIVRFIDDIADQTNVLALNAVIQASTAGDAGQGFVTVADEVQRLAERAGRAAKQIEMRLGTIRADADEAVASMEQATSDALAGVRTATGVGEALSEVESVSGRLNRRADVMTTLAREQSEQAGEIMEAVEAIRETTTEMGNGAEDAARSISELAERAQVLQRSAKGFPLPERDSPETAALLQHGARPGKAATTPGEQSSKAASLANLPREDDATPADAGS